MSEPAGPALSVILATADTCRSIATTMRSLRAQTVRNRLEIVIVAPSSDQLCFEESEVEGFWGCQVVALGRVSAVARANAAGIRRARAAVVALAEDHCFPEPGWAEALIAAHRGAWAAVGPVMRNANPGTMVSWADFLIGYGPWMDPAPAGPVPFLPGHNSSYKRAVALEYGDRLADMLEAETVLHMDLCRKGHALYLEPAARAAHMNFALLSSWLPVQFLCGRVFAGSRARGWSPLRRLFYSAASPLIPVVRLWRILGELRRGGRPGHLLLRVLPTLAAGLLLDGAGQMLGYAAGAGNAIERLTRFEFHRVQHVTEADRRAVARPAAGESPRG